MGKYLAIFRKVDTRKQEQEQSASPHKLIMGKKIRGFLPRSLGQEEALNPFIAYEGLFTWLISNSPAHFSAVCDAEKKICTLEKQRIIRGTEYEEAHAMNS